MTFAVVFKLRVYAFKIIVIYYIHSLSVVNGI